ncbi:MAG: hypothetical protein FWE01_01300 [Firmicutes bacterium]|nr:hypothetical protein [Bacillota bacterium]
MKKIESWSEPDDLGMAQSFNLPLFNQEQKTRDQPNSQPECRCRQNKIEYSEHSKTSEKKSTGKINDIGGFDISALLSMLGGGQNGNNPLFDIVTKMMSSGGLGDTKNQNSNNGFNLGGFNLMNLLPLFMNSGLFIENFFKSGTSNKSVNQENSNSRVIDLSDYDVR